MLLSWFVCVELGILPPCYLEPILINTIVTASPPPIDMSDIPALERKLLSDFEDVFDEEGPLKTMSGPPMSIELLPDAVPFAVSGPRPIPYALRDKAKHKLDDMEANKIIAPVTEPTPWTPMVIVEGPNGKLRVCVYLTKLNQYVKRPYYPLVSPKDAVSSIASGAKVFSTFDARHGYWQIPLDGESQLLTPLSPRGDDTNFYVDQWASHQQATSSAVGWQQHWVICQIFIASLMMCYPPTPIYRLTTMLSGRF